MRLFTFGTMTAMALALSGAAAQARELTFATFVPASSPTVEAVFQPWVDWFNEQAAAEDISVKLYAGGTLGRNPAAQAELVANGVADITITVPSYTPGVYPDYDIFELPGFAADAAEGSNAVKALYEEGMLRGYEDFEVIGAYTSGSYMLHSKPPIASYADIKDKKFRVSGQVQTQIVNALGAVPENMNALEMAENIDRGLIDGAVADASVAKTFRVSDVATNHYAADLGVLVFVIIMNKDVYEELPDSVKTALEDSRQFFVDRQVESYVPAVEANLAEWDGKGGHTVVIPSEADREQLLAAVQPVVEAVEAAATDGLLDAYRAKLEEFRAR